MQPDSMQVTNLSTMASSVFLWGRSIDEHFQFHSECCVSVPEDPLQPPAPAHEDTTRDLPPPHLTDLLQWGVQTPLTFLQALPQGVFFLKKKISNLQFLPQCSPRLLTFTTDSQSFSSAASPALPQGAPVCTAQCWPGSCPLDHWAVPKAPGPHPSVTTECLQWQPHPGLTSTWPQEAGGLYFILHHLLFVCPACTWCHFITTPAFNNKPVYFPSTPSCIRKRFQEHSCPRCHNEKQLTSFFSGIFCCFVLTSPVQIFISSVMNKTSQLSPFVNSLRVISLKGFLAI